MMDDEVQAMWDARADAVKAMAAGLPNPMDHHKHKVVEIAKTEPEDDDEEPVANDECLIADDQATSQNLGLFFQ